MTDDRVMSENRKAMLEHTNSDAEREAFVKTASLDQISTKSTVETLTSKPHLSNWNIFLLIASILLYLGAIVLLAYLWVTSIRAKSGSGSESFWYTIVSNDWFERTVTLSSVAIRLSIAWQATFCVTILASLILQHSKLPLSSIPAASILRTGNPTPWDILLLLGRDDAWKHTMNAQIWIVGVLLLLTTVSAQFTSTFLLSDIGEVQVAVENIVRDVPFDSAYGASRDYKFSPQLDKFPHFAEYREPSIIRGDYQASGRAFKAFLPFGNKSIREKLASYDGPLTAISDRVFCKRPDIQASLNFELGNLGKTLLEGEAIVNLNMTSAVNSKSPLIWPKLKYDASDTLRLELGSCKVIGAATDFIALKGVEWVISICELQAQSQLNIASEFDSRVTRDNGIMYLIVNSTWDDYFDPWEEYRETGGLLFYNSTPETKRVGLNDKYWKVLKDGPWTSFVSSGLDNRPRPRLDFSVCFSSPEVALVDVQLRTTSPLQPEPILDWDAYNSSITNSMDLLSLYIRDDERRYWASSLTSTDIPGPYVNASNGNDAYLRTFLSSPLHLKDSTSSIALCYYCSNKLYDIPPVSRSQAGIFQAVIQSTKNIALALETLFTIDMQSAYYDDLERFEIGPGFARPSLNQYGSRNRTATMTFYEPLRIPIMWRGFIVVIATFSLHLIIVLGVTTAFIYWSTMPYLDHTWQVVAQASRGEISLILPDLGDMSDDELQQYLKERKSNIRVGLQRDSDGTIGVVRK